LFFNYFQIKKSENFFQIICFSMKFYILLCGGKGVYLSGFSFLTYWMSGILEKELEVNKDFIDDGGSNGNLPIPKISEDGKPSLIFFYCMRECCAGRPRGYVFGVERQCQ
jgi:hypothetical protein